MRKCVITVLLLAVAVGGAFAARKDHLQACYNQQANDFHGQYLKIVYRETVNELEHSFEPWQATHFTGSGLFVSNARSFCKTDTIKSGPRTYFSKNQFDTSAYLFYDYGDKEQTIVTQEMFLQQYFKTARYAPAILINYFYQNNVAPADESNKTHAIYSMMIDKTVVKLFINKKTDLLEKVSMTAHEDQYGDVVTTFNYAEFNYSGPVYPRTVAVSKMCGKLNDTVQLSVAEWVKEVPQLIAKPAGYTMSRDTSVFRPSVTTRSFNSHIHFVELHHTNGKSMVVEFKDFLLVAEAPRSSRNGDLIIEEARKIAPGKPIKYFAFGHYHPDYIGGIRAFVHTGATVLCTQGDVPYVNYLAAAPYTLQPDSLQLFPMQLHTAVLDSSRTITDGSYEMKIYHMGKKSAHTADYLIYYFPAEKLLFEDDLASIPKEGPARKAWKGQAGLYSIIKDLGLEVTEIEQSWPIESHGVKSGFTFSELEAAMNVK